jgi:CheY-like chemotaxis protein
MRCPRILLADDAPEVRALLALVLGRAGADVRLAESGADALELAQQADAADAPFDVILLDADMPGLDGAATETRLRARGSAAPTLVLERPTRPDAVVAAVARCLAAGVAAGAFGFERGVLAARGVRERMEHLAARFAEGLPAHASALEGALAQGDVGEVSAIAQRLEDVAGTYGFTGVAEAAAELDDEVMASASLDQVRDRVARVAELCRSAATARLPL